MLLLLFLCHTGQEDFPWGAEVQRQAGPRAGVVGGLSPGSSLLSPTVESHTSHGAKWRLVHNALVHCHHGNIDRGH